MRINLPLGTNNVLEVADGADMHDISLAFAQHPAVLDVVRSVAKHHHFEVYPTGDDIDDITARKLAASYIAKPDSISEDLSETLYQYPATYYFDHVVSELHEKLDDVFLAVVAAIPGIDPVELRHALKDALVDPAISVMTEDDKSDPFTAIPAHKTVEVAFVQGMSAGDGIEDVTTDHILHASGAATIVPNEAFLKLLKLANVSVQEFLDAVRHWGGFDLCSPELTDDMNPATKAKFEASALEWRAVLDVEKGANENIRQLPLRTQYEITAWNRRVDLIQKLKDYDRPAAISGESLFTIVENASYGGAPVWTARLPLRDLLSGKFDAPFTAKGGFIGLHDFLNGSGYIETPDNELLIDPRLGRMYVSSTNKDAIDDVYGIVPSAWKCETAPAVIPEWQRVRPQGWRKDRRDGHVIINGSANEAGEVEYWVQSFDADGSEAGVRQTPEVFSTLQLAIEDGSSVFEQGFEAAYVP